MMLVHKIEIKPTKKQESLLRQSCGTARFTYNWSLNEWQKQYEAGLKPSAMSLKKQFNALKKEQFPWTSDVCRDASNTGFENIDKAFKNFFKKTAKYPRFKKKGKRDSFHVANDKFYVEGKKLHLPRMGKVKIAEEPRFTGKIMRGTVSRTAHKWFISIAFDVQDTSFPRCENQAAVGIDLGIKKLAVLSDGKQFDSAKALGKAMLRLQRQSRQVSRKVKGSNNRRKAVGKLARTHYRVSCGRSDSIHKLTHFVTANYRYIAIEDLNVAGMVKNHRLARSLSDASFGELRRQLEYKAKLYGNTIATVNRFYPSSKTCSACGYVNQSLTLADRNWTCPCCEAFHDRDENAAKNIVTKAFPLDGTLKFLPEAIGEVTLLDSRCSKAAG